MLPRDGIAVVGVADSDVGDAIELTAQSIQTVIHSNNSSYTHFVSWL